MNRFKEWMSGKKKIFGTLLAVAVMLVGNHNGWEPSLTRDISLILMGGVTVEGLVDIASMFKKGP